MRTAAALAMLAMAPSALQGAVPAARTLRVQLCSADGSARTVNIPVRPDRPQPAPGEPCCLVACHAGGSRKRSFCPD